MLRALLLIGMGLLSLLCMACGSENNSAADGEIGAWLNSLK